VVTVEKIEMNDVLVIRVLSWRCCCPIWTGNGQGCRGKKQQEFIALRIMSSSIPWIGTSKSM